MLRVSLVKKQKGEEHKKAQGGTQEAQDSWSSSPLLVLLVFFLVLFVFLFLPLPVGRLDFTKLRESSAGDVVQILLRKVVAIAF
jgi:hypothetical protein